VHLVGYLKRNTWHCMSADFLVNIYSSEKLKSLSVTFLITVICTKHICGGKNADLDNSNTTVTCIEYQYVILNP